MKFIKQNICLILVGIFLILYIFVAKGDENVRFVAGKYGKKCYIVGNAPNHIKYPQYFDDFQNCLSYLGNEKK